MESIVIYRTALEAGKTLAEKDGQELRDDLLKECDSLAKAECLYTFCVDNAKHANQNIFDLIGCCLNIIEFEEIEGFDNARLFLTEVNNFQCSLKKFSELREIALKSYLEMYENPKFSSEEFVFDSKEKGTEEQIVKELLPQLPNFYGKVVGIFYENSKFFLASTGYCDGYASFYVAQDAALAVPIYVRKALRACNKLYRMGMI